MSTGMRSPITTSRRSDHVVLLLRHLRQSWTGRIETRMYRDELDGQDRGYVVLTTGPSGSGKHVDLTGDIDVSAIVQAVAFDQETAKHLRQAQKSMQQANAAALRAIARRDKLSRKAA